jgi:hypothetical protein
MPEPPNVLRVKILKSQLFPRYTSKKENNADENCRFSP